MAKIEQYTSVNFAKTTPKKRYDDRPKLLINRELACAFSLQTSFRVIAKQLKYTEKEVAFIFGLYSDLEVKNHE